MWAQNLFQDGDIFIRESQYHGERVVVIQTKHSDEQLRIIVAVKGIFHRHHLNRNGRFLVHVELLLFRFTGVKRDGPFTLREESRYDYSKDNPCAQRDDDD